MSDTVSQTMTTSDDDSPALTEDAVVAWLRDNPDVLNRNPDLYDTLTPPREHSGKGIADFQYYMVQRLKADRDEVIESTHALVETSRENMSNLSRIHTAVLMILEARSFEDMIRTVTMDFNAVLGVDIVTLLVETDGDVVPHIDLTGVKAVPPGSVETLLSDQDAALFDHLPGDEAVFGGGAGLVNSQAYIRLKLTGETPAALLAFGSRDPDHFQPGQGVELIRFLAGVIERSFRQWLDLPPQ